MLTINVSTKKKKKKKKKGGGGGGVLLGFLNNGSGYTK